VLCAAVLNHINSQRQKGEDLNLADIAASFQSAVVDVLVEKTLLAAEHAGVKNLCLAGGVSANGFLRDKLAGGARERDIRLHLPKLIYCTDNAAMVGSLGYHRYLAGVRAELSLNAHAVLPIHNWSVDSRE